MSDIDTKIMLIDYKKKIISCKQAIMGGFIILGELLFYVRETKIYEDEYETFEAFLGDPEISFSRVTAYKMMRVFELYVKRLNVWDKVKDIDSDKLYMISDKVEEDPEEWIERARVLSRSDLRALLRENNGLPELEEKPISEKVKDFLYKYCLKKGIELDKIELEELLEIYEKWRRVL